MIHRNAKIGRNPLLQENLSIGVPSRKYLREKEEEWPETRIGDEAVLRSGTVIYCDVIIGRNFECGHNVLIREETIIGDNVLIGSNSIIEGYSKIGNNVRIESAVYIPSHTVIEDEVFIGPNAVLINDPHPMNCPRYRECLGAPVVKRLARIGANCTIMPGVVIGENSLVGAGSVVVKDVPPDSVVVGNPAKVIKKIYELKCPPGFFERPYLWPPYSERGRDERE